MKSHFLILTLMLCPALCAVAQIKIPKKACELPNGITIRYHERGPADGIPVILLHGFTDTSRSLYKVAEELEKLDKGLRIIVPDLRGHGNSSMPSESCAADPASCFTFSLLSNDIILLMDELSISKAYIAGHSLGGMIAQELALKHTNRVHSVTLIATLLCGSTNDVVQDFVLKEMLNNVMRRAAKEKHLRWPKDVYERTPANLGGQVPAFLRQNWVTEPAADEALLDAIAYETVATRMGTWIGLAKSIRDFDNRKALEQLAVPALVLYSTNDPVYPYGQTQDDFKRSLAAAVRNGNNSIVYKQYGRNPEDRKSDLDLGHNFHWTVPDRVAADIASFVRTQKPEPIHTFLDDSGNVVSVPATDGALSLLK